MAVPAGLPVIGSVPSGGFSKPWREALRQAKRGLVPTRDLRDHGARREGFRHDLRLDIVAPTTAQGSSLKRINNIRNLVAIRLLHDGTHIAGKAAHNKVQENSRFQPKETV